MLNKDKKDLIISLCDFTPEAEVALNHASKIAEHNHDEVRLLHIINNDTKSKLKKANEGEDAVYTKLKSIAEKNYTETKVTTSYHAEEGSIFSSVGEYVKESEAQLVVFGTHGVRGMQHIVGANSLKVILSCPAPVIVVQKKKADYHGYKKIMLPIDHSKFGKNKIAHAIHIAKNFGSDVIIFESQEKDPHLTNLIQNNVTFAANLLKQEKINYTHQKEDPDKGNFAKQIIKYSAEVDADLIVITSQHDTDTIGDFFFGNHEVDIINNDAQIAVMCVNPHQNANVSIVGVN
jgi:nucleotide-binding universal stress UspA family protein